MSKKWIKAATRRALWTFCETFIGAIGPAVLVEEVSWRYVLSASTLAAIISLAKSVVVGLPEVEE